MVKLGRKRICEKVGLENKMVTMVTPVVLLEGEAHLILFNPNRSEPLTLDQAHQDVVLWAAPEFALAFRPSQFIPPSTYRVPSKIRRCINDSMFNLRLKLSLVRGRVTCLHLASSSVTDWEIVRSIWPLRSKCLNYDTGSVSFFRYQVYQLVTGMDFRGIKYWVAKRLPSPWLCIFHHLWTHPNIFSHLQSFKTSGSSLWTFICQTFDSLWTPLPSCRWEQLCAGLGLTEQ